jgi:hypothetical protein
MVVKNIDQRTETGPGGVVIERTGVELEAGAEIIGE